ncbi:hypothetical protein QTN25_006555 [Entamoeba marina]
MDNSFVVNTGNDALLNWSLESDKAFLNSVNAFHNSLMSECNTLTQEMEKCTHDILSLDVNIRCSGDQLIFLSQSQYLENRIAEDEQKNDAKVQSDIQDLESDRMYEIALQQGLNHMDNFSFQEGEDFVDDIEFIGFPELKNTSSTPSFTTNTVLVSPPSNEHVINSSIIPPPPPPPALLLDSNGEPLPHRKTQSKPHSETEKTSSSNEVVNNDNTNKTTIMESIKQQGFRLPQPGDDIKVSQEEEPTSTTPTTTKQQDEVTKMLHRSKTARESTSHKLSNILSLNNTESFESESLTTKSSTFSHEKKKSQFDELFNDADDVDILDVLANSLEKKGKIEEKDPLEEFLKKNEKDVLVEKKKSKPSNNNIDALFDINESLNDKTKELVHSTKTSSFEKQNIPPENDIHSSIGVNTNQIPVVQEQKKHLQKKVVIDDLFNLDEKVITTDNQNKESKDQKLTEDNSLVTELKSQDIKQQDVKQKDVKQKDVKQKDVKQTQKKQVESHIDKKQQTKSKLEGIFSMNPTPKPSFIENKEKREETKQNEKQDEDDLPRPEKGVFLSRRSVSRPKNRRKPTLKRQQLNNTIGDDSHNTQKSITEDTKIIVNEEVNVNIENDKLDSVVGEIKDEKKKEMDGRKQENETSKPQHVNTKKKFNVDDLFDIGISVNSQQNTHDVDTQQNTHDVDTQQLPLKKEIKQQSTTPSTLQKKPIIDDLFGSDDDSFVFKKTENSQPEQPKSEQKEDTSKNPTTLRKKSTIDDLFGNGDAFPLKQTDDAKPTKQNTIDMLFGDDSSEIKPSEHSNENNQHLQTESNESNIVEKVNQTSDDSSHPSQKSQIKQKRIIDDLFGDDSLNDVNKNLKEGNFSDFF